VVRNVKEVSADSMKKTDPTPFGAEPLPHDGPEHRDVRGVGGRV
jgi:hypothetical protein